MPTEVFDLFVEYPIQKVDGELRLVTGVVLEPDEVDAQNDTITAEEIRIAAHRFLAEFNKTTEIGEMHVKFGKLGIELVESHITHEDTKIGGEFVKAGSWIMTVKVVSDKVWAAVKEGRLTGFSIGGFATITEPS